LFKNLKEKISITRQVDIWSWVGKVAPLTALTILSLVLFFDFETYTDYFIGFVALSFAVVAFTWWWWVIYAVRDLNKLLERTTEKFEHVIAEIKKLKKDLKN
jgi:heme/copper-type cytochrome/quinol oxidase subunit 2